MDITPKELLALAKACRKAGISRLKIGDIEFSLTDEAPEPQARKKRSKAGAKEAPQYPDTKFESDAPSMEELLFWSSEPMLKDEESNEQM